MAKQGQTPLRKERRSVRMVRGSSDDTVRFVEGEPIQDPPAVQDPSKPLRDERQETFAQLYAAEGRGGQAAAEAGFAPRSVPALMVQPAIVARVEHLRDQKRDALQRHTTLSRQLVVERLLEILDRCMQTSPVLDKEGEPTGEYRFDPRNALGALKLLGDELGMYQGEGNRTPDSDEARRTACAQMVLAMLRDERILREMAACLQPHDALCQQLITIWRAG